MGEGAMKMWRWSAVLLALLVGGLARGQQVRVEAVLPVERAFVGEAVTLQIVVENAQDVPPASIDAPAGLTIEYAGASHQPAPVWIVNGRRMDTGPDKYVLQYRVTALRAGEFTIPEQVVRVGGQEFRTRPVRLSAAEPPEDRSAILELSLSQERAYVGEPVTLTVTWLFVSDVQSVRFATTGDRAGYDMLPAADPRPAAARPDDARYAELEFDNQRMVFSVRRAVRGGREYTEVTGQRTIVPTRAGKVEIGPVVAMAQVRTGQRNVGILLTEPVLEPRATRGRGVTLEVLALPEQGRPAGFAGLVGVFSIEASAAPTSVSVGDPIELSVTIRGPEPLERVPSPDLERQVSFARSFRVDSDGLRASDRQGAGARQLSTTIRAMSSDVTEIPPIELAYFDTRTGRYEVARSAPIPLEVKGTRVVTARDAVTAAPGGGQSPAGIPVAGERGEGRGISAPIASARGVGLMANVSGSTALRDEGAGLRTLLTQPAWSVGVLAPPMAFVAAWAYRLARGRGASESVAVARATRVSLSRLRRCGDDPKRLADTIRAYAGARLGMEPAGVTSFEIERRLGGSVEGRELARLLDSTDAARLHGHAPPSGREVGEVIRGLAQVSPAEVRP